MQRQKNPKPRRQLVRTITMGCSLPSRLLCRSIEMICLATTKSSTASDKWRQPEKENFKSNFCNRLWAYRYSRGTVNYRFTRNESLSVVDLSRPLLGQIPKMPCWIRRTGTAIGPLSTALVDELRRAFDLGRFSNGAKSRTAFCPFWCQPAQYWPDAAQNQRWAIIKQALATGR